jgi:hypothetical protein
VFAAAIEAGWRTQKVIGKDDLLYAVQNLFQQSSDDAITDILSEIYALAPFEARARFLQRTVPNTNVRHAKG